MADIIDVQNALVSLAAQAIYPNGTGQPSAAGHPVMVYAGWPVPGRLEQDLAAGKLHISVYPRDDERNTTRYPKDWQTQAIQPATLTLLASSGTITIIGTLPIPYSQQNVAVFVNGKPYVYGVQATDTLTSIATALAALIAVDVPGTTSSGPVITTPGRLGALRVGTMAKVSRELRRQERTFQITIWAHEPAARDAAAQIIDPVLADTPFLTLPDGYAARLRYKGSPVTDALQKEHLYRRDLLYSVEYATTQTQQVATVVATKITVSADPSGQTITTLYD
jgi:hypothetical protein